MYHNEENCVGIPLDYDDSALNNIHKLLNYYNKMKTFLKTVIISKLRLYFRGGGWGGYIQE
jgi:hypothetical protein